MPSSLTFHTFRGLKLTARTWGNESSPRKVLALHGWLDNANTWDNLLPRLYENDPSRMYVVAIDFAGHGFSEHRAPQADYTHHANVEDAVSVIDALDWPSFTLLGHSMGASVASTIASILPEKIDTLIAIESLGTWIMPETAPETLSRFIRRHQSLKPSEKRIFPTLQEAITARANGIHKLSFASSETLIHRGVQRRGRGFEWSSDPRLRLPSPYRYTAESGIEFVQNIKARTLTIWAQDKSESAYYALEKRLPLVEKIVAVSLPGDHHLHLEEETVDNVAHVILWFLGYRKDFERPKLKTLFARL
ncbi:Alpha/Beta hydrolase protein [Chytridium lagenaria]|nr:Alpha/Beta hydrolase protein [Chytridium lagenaria]